MKQSGYAKLSNSLWRNLKIRKLISTGHTDAVGVYTLAISYVNDNLSDGIITEDELIYMLGATPSIIKTLQDAQLIDKTDDQYIIHDYLDWQRSKSDIEHDNQKNRERQKTWYNKHKKQSNKNLTPLETDPNTQLTGKPRTKNQEPNKRDFLSENPEKNQKPVRNPEQLKTILSTWQPNKTHYQLANNLAAKGYPHVNITDLAHEFTDAIISKANRYQYVDFDAAFNSWIRNRATTLRDNQQTTTSDPTKNNPPQRSQISDYELSKLLEPYSDDLLAVDDGLGLWLAQKAVYEHIADGYPPESAVHQAVAEVLDKRIRAQPS